MDVHLGDANGLRLIEALRKSDGRSDVPVIVVSADGMRQTVCEAVSAEVQGYVRKPYDPALLVEKVKNALAEANVRRLAWSSPGEQAGCRITWRR
jgi:DNA-binding NarL/FixJ family response regulator